MPDGVEESLSLDISAALTGIGQLDDALTQVTQSFSVGLADALSTLTNVGADVTPLADSLDVAGLGPAVDTAIADATSDPFGLTLDADATPITDAIDQATSTPQTVPVEADTTSATQAIDSLDSTPITLEVDADTTAAQSALDDLGDSATKASGGTGGEGLAGLAGNLGSISTATELATGNVTPLAEGFASVGAGAAAAVAGGVAFGAFVGETTKLAADAEAQNKRFASTFGDLADQVSQIHVGGLNTDIETLGRTSGTTDADLKAVASRIGALGQSAGASNDTIVKTTDNLLALGATFSVNNPRLGDAASVTDRLTNAFARGGRALAPFGLALSAAQINAEALAETGKTSAADLTLFEKSTAGANLAVKIFGDTLGTKFQQGAQSADVQFRALKVAIEETLVAVGQPLLQPLVQTFTDLLPVAQQVGIVLGQLARIVLPLVADIAPALTPVAAILGVIGVGLGAVGDAVAEIPGPVVLTAAAFGGLALALTGAADGMIALAIASAPVLGPIALIGGGLAALGFGLEHFGKSAQSAETDTSGLASAFTVTSDAASGLGVSLGDTAKTIDAFVQKQLAIKTQGVTGFQVLNLFGQSVSQVDTALQGTTDSFNQFYSSAKTAFDPTPAQTAAIRLQSEQLLDSRDALEANAKTSLDAAVASGVLTRAQVDNAVHATIAADGTRDYITALKEVAPTLNANTAAQTTNQLAVAEASPTYAALVSQLGAGAISVDQFSSALQTLGVAAPAADAFAKSLSDSITTMVQTINAGLPSINDAFSTFLQGEQDAFSQLADDAKNGTGSVADDFAALNAASDPSTLITNIQAQTDQINGFLLTIEVLRSQGRDRLAKFFVEQGVGSLATAAQAAGDSAVAATEGAAVRQNDAARAKVAGLGVELVTGASTAGTDAGTALVTGVANAIDGDTSAPAAAKAKGDQTGQAFAPDISAKVKAQFGAGAAAITQLTDTQIQAGIIGVQTGEDFGQGLANGIGEKTDVIVAAATAAAKSAEQAAKDALKSKSPSLVAKQIGSDFTTGLALGIVDQAPKAADASTVLANAVVKQLQDALKAATAGSSTAAQTAAQSAFTSFVSGAVNSLPSVGAGISKFASDITSATSAQAQALAGLHKASQDAALDQLRQARLATLTGVAYGGLTNALNVYNAANAQTEQATASNTAAVNAAKTALDAASANVDKFKTAQQQSTDAAKQSIVALSAARSNYDAIAASTGKDASKGQKDALDAAKQQLSDAEQAFNDFARKLETATNRTTDALKTLRQARRTLKEAQDELDQATDPATFTKNLRAQTAAANQFAKDIAKLSREGFTDLAKQLADAGPDAAGELARGFASSKSKAKAAEAAVDAASTFSTNFQAELTRLFGPSGGAVDAAHTAGTSIGQSLTTGLQVSSQAGTAAALAGISSQIAAGIPQIIPLVAALQVQKALTPVAANAPTIIQTPTLAGQNVSQSLELDLTIVLDDGRTVTAQTSVPFTPAPTRSLKQLVRAQVHAS